MALVSFARPGLQCAMNARRQGLVLAFAGVVILSFDSLLVRLVDASAWDLLFWRGALLALTLVTLQAATGRGSAPQAMPTPWPLVVPGSLAFAASMVFFVLSVDNTQVASTLVIVNTAPFFAAIIAFLFLKERIAPHTAVAIGIATVGIVLIFEYAPSTDEIPGDVFALVSALGTASYLVVMRCMQGENGAGVLIIAGAVTALVALAMGADPTALEGMHVLYMAILGCLVVPGSGLCIARAPKYLPAAQTGLILLMEILLGPLFVYLALGEQPSGNDIEGGVLILFTLAGHTLWEEMRSGTRNGLS